MEIDIPKVAAVVVSFNRKNLLVECIDALLRQSRPLDKIIIIDNKSTDGTAELLDELGYFENPSIEIRVLESNVGGAGGFEAGLRQAVEAGYDWVWLMDDDAEPQLDAYEICSAFLTNDNALVAPNLGDADGKPDYTSMHRGILLGPEHAKVDCLARSISEEEAARGETAEIHVCSFVGPFISAKAVRQVGLPRKEFFIHFDDIEFTLRLGQYRRLLLVPKAIIKHKQVATIDRTEIRKTILGPKLRIRFERMWSTYFGYRNQASLIRTKTVPTTMITLLLHHMRVLITTVLYDDRKISRISFYNSALIDGLLGRFDNERPKRWKI
ncbi:glycosyltransferase family 2 protein [Neorhizobium sp. LMR1-1-1.1]